MTADPAPDLSALRGRFPGLDREVRGRPAVFADAPGGTQAADTVIEAMAAYLRASNANRGGAFPTSEETDRVVDEARRAGADLLGCDADEVVVGPNMTTLAFALSRSLARTLGPGDEVVVTALDHDANVAPWLLAARDTGAAVRWVDLRAEDGTLDPGSLDAALSERTRVVAFTAASNALGTIPPAREVARRARRAGAVAVLDAVHYTPHRAVDVRDLGVDVLFCSAYKFFGPHLGLMFARRELLDGWEPYKVRPAPDRGPDRWEAGTQNHEGLAGLVAAVDYLAEVGRKYGSASGGGRRAEVATGMEAIRRYEAGLTVRFLEELPEVPGARLFGIADPGRAGERTPTFALRLGHREPRAVAEELGRRGVFVWDGNYYALAVMEALGLEETGGAVRVGFPTTTRPRRSTGSWGSSRRWPERDGLRWCPFERHGGPSPVEWRNLVGILVQLGFLVTLVAWVVAATRERTREGWIRLAARAFFLSALVWLGTGMAGAVTDLPEGAAETRVWSAQLGIVSLGSLAALALLRALRPEARRSVERDPSAPSP